MAMNMPFGVLRAICIKIVENARLANPYRVSVNDLSNGTPHFGNLSQSQITQAEKLRDDLRRVSIQEEKRAKSKGQSGKGKSVRAVFCPLLFALCPLPFALCFPLPRHSLTQFSN